MYFFNTIFLIIILFSVSQYSLQSEKLNSRINSINHWKENGQPYVINFSPNDYGGEIQNFSIVQDKKGYIYSGNNIGVLVFDGKSWQVIYTPFKTTVRSLTIINDTVYVGTVGDFGYLAVNELGKLSFFSLKKYLPAEKRNFQDIYEIIYFNNAVYFRTRFSIFIYDGNIIKSVDSSTQFGDLLNFKDKLFTTLKNGELYQIKDDSLHFMLKNSKFKSVRTMLGFNNSSFLVTTFEDGIFLYDGTINKFITEADDYFKRYRIYEAIKLKNNLFAFATNRGVVILDKFGKLCKIINKSSGLRDDFVIGLTEDREDGLWLALNNGIARVETPSLISRFQDSNGFESFVVDILRFNGKIYASGDRGVYYLDNKLFPFPKFKKVTGFTSLTFSLKKIHNNLFAGTQDGVFIISDTSAIKINDLPARFIYQSKIEPNLIYVGLVEGLAAIKYINNKWITSKPVKNFNVRINSIVEDIEGSIWFGTSREGLIKAKVKTMLRESDLRIESEFIFYTEKEGLPSGRKKPFFINDRLIVATINGLKYFDKENEYFYPDSTFGKFFSKPFCEVKNIKKDESENIWMISNYLGKVYVGKAIPNSDGSYTWFDKPFARINDLGNIYLIYPEKDGTVWFGGSEGIARYSSIYEKQYNIDFPTVIRNVKDIGSDSIYYFGNYNSIIDKRKIKNNSSLRFEFASLFYDAISGTFFQHKLDNYDEKWSEWSSETWKEYTGLPKGEYTFRVRAKNIYGQISREDKYSFIIQPAWYQKWWAYVIYILSVMVLFFLLIKFRVRQLEKHNRNLEKIISERTSTINSQSEKLKKINKLKSQFFANISHEFRTPLTVILGIIDKHLKIKKEKNVELKVIGENAKRLLKLINQLLDLSSLESGTIKMKVQKTEIVKFLINITSSFIPLIDQKKLSLKVNGKKLNELTEFVAIWGYIDRDKFETIISNLLSNAIKFSPEGENISVQISSIKHYFKITIINSGVTISKDKLDKIFERFYQIENNSTGDQIGTGIGLALVKEFTELHHGEVKVESSDQITSFTIKLLLGNKHFSDTEIINNDELPEELKLNNIDQYEIDEKIEAKFDDNNIENNDELEMVLVVEDHPDLRKIITDQLKNDYNVIEADNGQLGLQLAEEKIPDLIISDIMMPKMDGYDLCSLIKKNMKTNHIPIIILTAKAAIENKLKGLEIGADDYLIKPFNPFELQTRVKNLILNRRRLREKFSSEIIIKPADVIVPSSQKVFIEKVTNIIEENLEDELFSVEHLSSKIGLSRVQLHRKIKALCNQSTSEFIRTYRLQKAVELIKQDAGNFTEIAFKVGFNSQAYFNKSFQKMYGVTPSEYKKNFSIST